MSRRMRLTLVVIFVLASLPVLPAMAAACTWTGAINTDWATPGNWSSCDGGVPGALDSATIGLATNQPVISTDVAVAGLTINSIATLTINPGATLTVSGAATLGGALGGSGDLLINGSLNWTGGTMSGSGVTTMAPDSTLTISGTWETLDRRTLNQGGTAIWTGTGYLSFSNGAVFNNQAGASLDARDNARMYFEGSGATPAFNNAGLFRKSVASGTTEFNGVPFNNTGTVSVTMGTLQLDSGGTSSGAFAVAAGATLDWRSGTHNLDASSSVSGAGTVSFGGATVNLTGAYNVTGLTQVRLGNANFHSAASTAQLALSSGMLGGTGVVTVTSMTWTGGTMSGSGMTTIVPGGTLTIDGSWKTLDRRTLNQGGTAIWTGTGYLSFSNGAVFNNQAGASLDARDNARMNFDGSGATPAFNNAGLFRKSVATGTTVFSGVPFNNTGTVDVQSGILEFGSFIQISGSTLLNGGSLASSDPVNIQGGILSGTGTVDADVTNAGHIVPGGNASPGNIVATGDYVQTAAGVLDIDIGGLTAVTQYDRIDIRGRATLNGRLNVTLINGYVPTAPGTSFRVMNYASHSGTFVTTTGLDMGNGKFLLPLFTVDHMILVSPYHVYSPVTLR